MLFQTAFEGLNLETPNAETIAALEEYDDMKKHPEKYTRYSSFKELLSDIDIEIK